ncbi:hypothetical protein [Novosphingobium kaempferiae]|nr:hypothetical protein [Novosphingobium kaempferiae]
MNVPDLNTRDDRLMHNSLSTANSGSAIIAGVERHNPLQAS